MAIPFMPIALGLLGAGDIISGFGRAQQVSAYKNDLKTQARILDTEEAQRSADRMTRLRQVLAANIASAGGLGIDPGSASVVAVQEASARAAGRAASYDKALTGAQASGLRARANALSPTSQIVSGFLSGGSRLLPLLAQSGGAKPPSSPRSSNSSTDLARRTERLFGFV